MASLQLTTAAQLELSQIPLLSLKQSFKMQPTNPPNLIIYNTADDKASVSLLAKDGQVWMNQSPYLTSPKNTSQLSFSCPPNCFFTFFKTTVMLAEYCWDLPSGVFSTQ